MIHVAGTLEGLPTTGVPLMKFTTNPSIPHYRGFQNQKLHELTISSPLSEWVKLLPSGDAVGENMLKKMKLWCYSHCKRWGLLWLEFAGEILIPFTPTQPLLLGKSWVPPVSLPRNGLGNFDRPFVHSYRKMTTKSVRFGDREEPWEFPVWNVIADLVVAGEWRQASKEING